MTRQVPLARLANYVNGRPFKPEDKTPTGLPVVKIRQLVDPAAKADYFDGPVEPRHLVRDGDLIFSWSATLAVDLWDRGPAVLNQHLFNVHPVAGVDKRWLRWALVASIGRFQSLMHGSAMTHITKEMLRDVALPLPTLDDQRRKADFVDHEVRLLDQVIDLRRVQQRLLEERLQSLLDLEMQRVAERGGYVRAGRLIRGIEQGWSPQCEGVPAQPHEVGVLKAGAVKRGSFQPHENKRLPDGLAPQLQYLVKPGDLLMTRANTPKLVGDVAVVPADAPSNLLLCDKIMRIRTNGRKLSPRFFAWAARSTTARAHLSSASTGTSQSMVNIRAEDIRGLPLPRANLDDQALVVQRLEAARDFAVGLAMLQSQQGDLLVERRRALIDAVVTGGFDVTTARSVA